MQRKLNAGSFSFLLLALAALLAFPFQSALAQQADLILKNGKILTVDNDFSIAEAVAVAGNKILAVGKNDDIAKMAGPNAQVIDLKGKTVVPGLIDSHRHSYAYSEGAYGGLFGAEALHRYPLDWRGVRTKDDVLNQLKGQMAKYKFKPGQWIYFVNELQFIGAEGGTLEQAKILYNDLNQWELDKVTPNNPVVMSLGIPDFNGFLVNKQAMDYLWAKNADYIKKNGRYWIDATGRPDGHLEPPAARIVLPFTYDRAPDVLGGIYKYDIQEASSMGLTTVVTRLPQDSLAAYKMLDAKGELNQRIGYGVIEAFGAAQDLKTPGKLKEYAKAIGTGTDKIWITGTGPTAVDGSTSRACTNQKRTGTYTVIDSWFPVGQCHMDSEYKGSPLRAASITENYYRDWTMASGRDGVRFANTHVAGDRAVGLLLNVMEQLQKQYGPDSTKNWAFDHCDMVDPADFKRMGKMGVTMSCYVQNSVNRSAQIAEAYGDKVANTFASPLKSMVDNGVKVVLESDSNTYVWTDIQAAVMRKDRKGKVWGPQERVDRPTALRMYTRWAADYALKGNIIGSIEPGKMADLVVLDQDYLTMPGDDIGKIKPQLTVFDGRITFVHPDYSKANNLQPKGATISTYEELIARRKRMTNYSGGG
jgi:predicted amidohydrolase YtcJ